MPVPATPSAPRFEHHAGDVLGIGTAEPRLSWTVQAEAGWRQSAYEIEVVRGTDRAVYGVNSCEQVLVPWPAPPLQSRERAVVRVRVADGQDCGDWGPAAVVEAGLLTPRDWRGSLICPATIGGIDQPAPVLSASLHVPGDVRRARLYATGHGIYVPRINGERVDETVLAPGWTAYEHRLRYQTYDVTHLVQPGETTIEVLLGNGWWRGYLGYLGERALYGDRLALLAQLEVTTADGVVHTLATDSSWQAHESEVVADDLYMGQTTDLRRRGQHQPRSGVEVLATDLAILVAPQGPPMRPTQILPAVRVWRSPSGRTLVDFGQNAVGWVRLRVRDLPAGTEVTVRHAEVLEDDELGTRPLRAARATDTYVLSGGEQVLEPSLTFHGFRYAEVTGIPDLRADDLELVVIGSDLQRAGWFSSSNPLLDRMHENVVWGTRGNFLDVPTDCPQRDERLGWTGDIQVFAPTATFLFDVAGFLTSWLADLAAEQYPDGAVPHVIPDVNRSDWPDDPGAAWGDAAVLVPWTLYDRTGDLEVLERALPSMRAWVDRVAELAGPTGLWIGGFQFGDWLDPDAPPEDAGAAKADRDVVATAHFARSASTVAAAAAALGRDDVAARYQDLAAGVREAFAGTFVTPTGRVLSDAQTVYALALEWDLLPTPQQRLAAGDRLADLVRQAGYRISTGFVGTPLICDALTNAGHVDVAYRLLLQTRNPSWLYPVTMGATTVWERWDSMLPDGSINPSGMTSFNHYALGAVADWMHRVVAGLAPAAPGYRTLRIAPRPTVALTRASARHRTPYGEAVVAWTRDGGTLTLDVHVPVGASAQVHVPGVDDVANVGPGAHTWQVPDPVLAVPDELDWATATIRDLLDHSSTWVAVVAAAERSDYPVPPGSVLDVELARRLGRWLDRPAREVDAALAPDGHWPYAAALRQQLAGVVPQHALA